MDRKREERTPTTSKGHGSGYTITTMSAAVKKFEIQARNISSNSKEFWTEIFKVNPISEPISNSIGEANGSAKISQ